MLFPDLALNKGFPAKLRWLDWIFWGEYLPSLSINYVAMSKDKEKRFPQKILLQSESPWQRNDAIKFIERFFAKCEICRRGPNYVQKL